MRIKKILPFILLVFLFISCEKEDTTVPLKWTNRSLN